MAASLEPVPACRSLLPRVLLLSDSPYAWHLATAECRRKRGALSWQGPESLVAVCHRMDIHLAMVGCSGSGSSSGSTYTLITSVIFVFGGGVRSQPGRVRLKS